MYNQCLLQSGSFYTIGWLKRPKVGQKVQGRYGRDWEVVEVYSKISLPRSSLAWTLD